MQLRLARIRPRFPSGRFAYVLNLGASDLAIFSVNAATGGLTLLAPRIPAGAGPTSLTLDSQGRFAYVTDNLSGSVSVFAVDAVTGSLTATSSAPVGANPVALSLDPSGRFAYVANFGSDDITQFTVDPRTGALAPIGSPANAGTGPVSLAFTK